MLTNNIIIHINRDNKVPKGFIQWFIMLDKLKNETFYKVEEILENNDLFGAQLFFEEHTLYNKGKTWH